MNLLSKIETKEAVVAIIGLGYVGLPLAVVFAEAGFHTVGIDLDQSKVEAINRGESYIQGISSETLALLASNGRRTSYGLANTNGHFKGGLSATTDYDALYDADAVIVCVPTPLSKTKDPDVSYIVSATDEIAQRLHHGMLIVLESTTYPGTTEELVLPCLEQAASRHSQSERIGPFNVGEDFFLAFSPERIDPGREDWTVKNTPKVLGGVTDDCKSMAVALYGSVVERVVPVSSPKVAEMVKLLENTFRATNIALVNEMAIMCDRLGVNVWEVIDAAGTKPFGFMPFYPGPGLGGHCIPIDPHYLAWKLKTLNYNARFIQLAEEVNFGMPAYVVGKIGDALNRDGLAMQGSRVLVLGVTYKADVGDLRESPALELIHLLLEKGADVSYNDPYIERLEIDGVSIESVFLDLNTLQEADCVVITTAHKSYDWNWIAENSRLIVDTRNATKSSDARTKHVVKL